MFRLHGKSAQKLIRPLMFTQIFQNIICPFHLNREFSVRFLHFLLTDRFRTIICHSRRLDHDILPVRSAGHRFIHLSRCCNRHHIHKEWWFYGGFSTDQCHLRTSHATDFCNRISHFSAGMIRQIPHRIDRFLSRSCCHKDFFAFQIFFISHFL